MFAVAVIAPLAYIRTHFYDLQAYHKFRAMLESLVRVK